MIKPIRITIISLFTIFLPMFAGISPAAAQDSARVNITLVKAGNQDSGIDSSLRAYASTLQRLFRFKSYQQIKRQTLTIQLPGEEQVGLAMGQSLRIQASPSGKSALNAEVEWLSGSKRLLHTRIQLRPGSPAVLGGPRSGEETWLLILEAR